MSDPSPAPTPTNEQQDAVRAAVEKILRWGVDEARERDAMYEEACAIIRTTGRESDEHEDEADALTERIEAGIARVLAAVSAAAPDERKALLAQAWKAAQARYPGESGLTDASRGAFIVGWSSCLDAALAARPAPVVSGADMEPTFTERQAAAWPVAVERINRHGVYASDDPTDYNWTLHWADEVRPGRGHYLDAQFNNGEHFAQITMDVYGDATVSIATLDWVHADNDDECDCEHCQADRDSDAEADASLTVADAPAADDEPWECQHQPRCADAACSHNPAMKRWASGKAADDEGARA